MKSIDLLTQQGIVNWGNLNRIKKVIERAMRGEEVVIGFIGGSITQGSLSSTSQTCYAYLVYQWWEKTFPTATFKYVNAGVGGTNSYYGTSRVDEHLLVYQPDFVIVEFSVNDKANEFFKETYEGLLRRILYSESQPAVMVINNMFYDSGFNAQAYHNQIAKAYELPILSIKDSLYPEILDKNLEASALTPDNLHPNDSGHRLISEMISSFLMSIKRKIYDSTIEEQEAKNRAVTKNRFEDSKRIQSYNANPILKGFTQDDSVQECISDNFKRGWEASALGDCISFDIECSSIGVQYRKTIHKPAPIAKLTIDHQDEEIFVLDANFEETWGDSLNLDFIKAFEDKVMHHIEIKLINVDESNQTPFYLVGLVIS